MAVSPARCLPPENKEASGVVGPLALLLREDFA